MGNKPWVIPLGTSSALPGMQDANSYLAVGSASGRYWLVDCADSPIPRLERAGIDPLAVEGLFITHFHPDHVYGLPAYWLGLMMLARERGIPLSHPVRVCARAEVLSDVKALAAVFQPQGWLEEVPLVYQEVAAQPKARVADTDAFVVYAAPTAHSLPSMAVRFEVPESSRAFVYSGDTEPTPGVEQLAQDANLLFHEATGDHEGHSSAAQAGSVAAVAGVERLVLIHLAGDPAFRAEARAAAQAQFGGPVEVAEAFRTYSW